MKTPIIDGFSEAGLVSYLNTRQYSALYWPTLFPIKPVDRLDGKTMIGSVGSRIAAYVISYDTKAPETTRKSLTTQHFDIPKVAVARKKTEEEIIEHHITKAIRGNDAVLEDYFNDIDYVYDAVQARMEWMALAALSATKFTLSTTNNPMGIVNETAVSFGMPTANQKVVTTATWTTGHATTMVPITDFKKVVKAGRDAGVQLTKALMDADTFDLITGSTEFQNAVKQFVNIETTVVGLESLALANKVMNSLRLPEIVIINTSVGIENAAGTISYSNPWDTNHVTFIPDGAMGSMFAGPIAEEIEKPLNVLQSKRGPVLVSIQKEFNPVAVVTKGEANVFPSWPMVDKCFSLYHQDTGTWA
ncbi:MAG: major capsid protein [Methanoregula sp.]|jgi:hypothetical protein|nr:major capsid protein [Methanoregula sp.]